MAFQISYACVSHVGRRRKTNQDNFVCDGFYMQPDDEKRSVFRAGTVCAHRALFGVFAFALVLLLNLYICPYRIGVRSAVWGSLLTVLLGGLASFGFSVYAHLGTMEKLYGAAVFLIVFLLWLYLLMAEQVKKLNVFQLK